jgi:predicted phosphodiesterase
MKVAVLADIHANWVALQAVYEDIQSWKPDLVLVGGDVVNRGPKPAECLQFIQEKQRQEGWRMVRGNHEDYVIMMSHPDAPRQGPAFEVHLPVYWTYQRLGCDVSALEAMSLQQSFNDPAGGEFRLVHASMLGSRDGIYPETSDRELAKKIEPPPAVFCVGHTHRPLIRRLNGTLVVNVGSAGLPFDLETRPSYGRFTWRRSGWTAEIVRVDYDLQQAEQDFYDTGYLAQAGPLVDLVLIELRTGRSQLFNWAIHYQDLALQGKISMQESVNRFLQNRGS